MSLAAYKARGASTAPAGITRRDGGGFVAVASTDDLDRDGEIIAAGALSWTGNTVPVHLDHTMSAASVIGRARPAYEGRRLMVDVTLASTADAQLVRQKVADGVLDSVSIVFLGQKWENREGVRTCVKGELLAVDVVSVPAQPNARILSARSLRMAMREITAEARAEALLALVAAEVAESKAFLLRHGRGHTRHRVDAEIRSILR